MGTLAERPLVRKTLKYSSSGAGIASAGPFVKLTTNVGECIESNSANDIPEGILQENLNVGDQTAQLITMGEVKVIGSEAIGIGKYITPTTAGKFKKLEGSTSTYAHQYIYGRMKEPISQNNYEGLADINHQFFIKKDEKINVYNGGTISASSDICYIVVPFKCTLKGVYIVPKTTISKNDTDYHTFTLVNKGQAGSGSTAMLAVSDANTTKLAGIALTAYVPNGLTVHGTAANLDCEQNDVLVLANVKSASGANIVQPLVFFDFELKLPGSLS